MTTFLEIVLKIQQSVLLLVGDLQMIEAQQEILLNQTPLQIYNVNLNMFHVNVWDQKVNNTREGADMEDNIHVGDRVRLIGLPDWLIHDLPEEEQIEMKEFIGQCATVNKIDAYGYIWIGFSHTVEVGETAYCSGHEFGVPKDFLSLCANE